MHDTVSRRQLGRILTAAALTTQATPAQAPPAPAKPSADQDLEQAKTQMRANFAAVARVKLPLDVEPAFQFKA
jgi:hypothetical protein